MAQTLITIVVTPRDRFCFTQANLESILQNADIPYELIYVDGGSPDHIREYIKKASLQKKFQLIRIDHYLTPNQSRNLAWKQIKTPYAIFVENDVAIAKGALSAMLRCAEETGCDVVCPLTCQDKPIHENIHYAGGDLEIKERVQDGRTERYVYETMTHKQGSKHFDITPPLQRTQAGYTEVHCFLVRTDMLKMINGFDEGVMSTRDHVDFSLNVKKAGGKIYFEPRSVITFMGHFTAQKLEPWEEGFYKLRWSDAWEYNSLRHISKKWNLTEDRYFKNRYSRLGWRRRSFVIKPKIKHIRLRVVRRLIEEVMVFFDRIENKKLTTAFAQKYGKG